MIQELSWPFRRELLYEPRGPLRGLALMEQLLSTAKWWHHSYTYDPQSSNRKWIRDGGLSRNVLLLLLAVSRWIWRGNKSVMCADGVRRNSEEEATLTRRGQENVTGSSFLSLDVQNQVHEVLHLLLWANFTKTKNTGKHLSKQKQCNPLFNVCVHDANLFTCNDADCEKW